MNPSKIVQQYMEAYNRRDIEAFLSFKHPEFQSSLFDENIVLCANLNEATVIYTKRFRENTNLYVTTLGRIINDNIVIDNQLIEGFDDGKTIRAISIFELKNGLVYRASFARREVNK